MYDKTTEHLRIMSDRIDKVNVWWLKKAAQAANKFLFAFSNHRTIIVGYSAIPNSRNVIAHLAQVLLEHDVVLREDSPEIQIYLSIPTHRTIVSEMRHHSDAE